MGQTRELIATLKAALKSQGKTYADVARELGLAEASVKRIFSQQSFSLDRLDRVCHMLGMEISDLVQMMNERRQQLQQLSWEQEQLLQLSAEDILQDPATADMWLRGVQQDPSDFLAIKFSMQLQRREGASEATP